MSDRSEIIRLGITLGDPAGIGPEIVLKALHQIDLNTCCQITLFGDSAAIGAAETQTGLECPDTVDFFSPDILHETPMMGQINAVCGQSAWASLRLAIDAVMHNKVDALVTGPIHKESFRAGGASDLDHTTMLKRITKADEATTVFILDNLRIFFLTRHLPLRAVADSITSELLEAGIRQCLAHLHQMGVKDALLAVAALNPHGGDGGLIGNEDDTIIKPVIKSLQRQGLYVTGPVPADSVFHLAREGRFDGVLSLYHDQGHIAIKTLDFHRTVALTLGLPFLRTSVDHGTAFDIAGRNMADASGMVEAIYAAERLAHLFC
ncbi:4-hydroxythreonine-4-phosphate dehydrogenase PdxA [bacterium]|nr:4-hydroxythreonine-4-phosphate dehydrogenase PdxA [bacterium]